MSRDGVQVLSILGRDYSIRVPAGEERALADAAALLQAEVDANKRKFPYVTSNELVVLSALNSAPASSARTTASRRACGRWSSAWKRWSSGSPGHPASLAPADSPNTAADARAPGSP